MTTVTQQQQPTEVPVGVSDESRQIAWGSDVVMEMLRRLGIEYASVLPGATFRGIHDSAVNYTANRNPELILCGHEMITVAMANGYARVTGKPMAVMLHNVVGLLNASMTIYDAWCDRVPVLIIGGTGPVDATRRRPWIDWVHTANVQGNLVRDFTKWDDQPASVAAIPESLMRAYRIAVTQPAGPVYVNFDADLQEQELKEPFALPDVGRYRPAAPQAPNPDALREAARLLVSAELPLGFADRVGRNRAAVGALLELAELLALPVADFNAFYNFPTPHPLDFAGMERELLKDADVVLGLDMVDLDGATRLPVDPQTRVAEKVETDRKVISISLDEYLHRGLATDYQALPAVDVPMLADTAVAIPMLVDEVRSLLDGAARERIERRRTYLESRQAKLRERQRSYVEEQWNTRGINEVRLVGELWAAIKDTDFSLTRGRVRRMAPGIFQMTDPSQFLGFGIGGAVGSGPGVALGAALALKNSGKIPVAILGDGETFASMQALWTAAHYQIPSLWVINNNRSYYNDEAHQKRVSKVRGRPLENAWIGQRLENPEVDFNALSRSIGVEGFGPVKDPSELGPVLRKAVEAVQRGQMAVVDVWTELRKVG